MAPAIIWICFFSIMSCLLGTFTVSLGLIRSAALSSPPLFAAFLGGGAPPSLHKPTAAAARNRHPCPSQSNAAFPAVREIQGKAAWGRAPQEKGDGQQHLSATRGTDEEEEEEGASRQTQEQEFECLLSSTAREKEASGGEEEVITDRVPLTDEAVESVLQEINPMLHTHGGSVRLLETNPEKRQVTLQLQGACVGCPSSAMTLRNGIEQTLQDVWPGLTVIEADPGTGNEEEGDDGEAIDANRVQKVLRGILPAIQQMGGNLSITNTANGSVTVQYEGPNAVTVKYGIEMELNDKLPGAAGLVTVECREVEG